MSNRPATEGACDSKTAGQGARHLHESQPTATAYEKSLFPLLRLGATAFGGPAAHIAMMEEEFVRRRRWLSHQEFLDMLGASNLVPVRVRRKWRFASVINERLERAGNRRRMLHRSGDADGDGVRVGLLGFGIASSNSRRSTGSNPVIIAVVLQALWTLARGNRDEFLAAIGPPRDGGRPCRRKPAARSCWPPYRDDAASMESGNAASGDLPIPVAEVTSPSTSRRPDSSLTCGLFSTFRRGHLEAAGLYGLPGSW